MSLLGRHESQARSNRNTLDYRQPAPPSTSLRVPMCYLPRPFLSYNHPLVCWLAAWDLQRISEK
ncbi:hypothetical protein CABS01_02820 [Colletotrichum abscissum]|uniref:uncharacterized protein n=1 Tax=Colletotrichum abscissum TaxID=1671311 RepID=UPI0027D6071C|nr:uncharacterized protein CABS01_02820 [Colletotrichum abscissum]KAK1483084.1 hypothetical protein CABS01_02820 [Colletotrichum abscissum]